MYTDAHKSTHINAQTNTYFMQCATSVLLIARFLFSVDNFFFLQNFVFFLFFYLECLFFFKQMKSIYLYTYITTYVLRSLRKIYSQILSCGSYKK